MLGNFIFEMGYEAHLRRNGLKASPEAEAAYRAQVDENRRKNKADEERLDADRRAHLASLPVVPMPFVKAGRLRESTLGGSIVHAVMSNGEDRGMDASWPREAICGDAPKILWSAAEGQAITCPKCLRRMPS